MTPKKFTTKRQKSKFEEDCYDASSLEVDYDSEETDDTIEDEEDADDEVIEEITVTVESLDPKPKKRGPKPSRVQFYVEPKEFDDCIIKYYETGNITDELATMINKIAHKLSYAPNFINYTYRDEMVGDAVVRMMKALIAKKYTHKKGSNPFSYFTKIAFNAFRNRIKREKYAHDVLQKYQEEVIMTSDYNTYIKPTKNISSSDESFYIEE